MKNKISPFALSLIVLGVVLILKTIGEVTAPFNYIYGNMLLFYGIVSVFINIGSKRKGALFIGVLSFMVGVVLFVFNHYDILSTSRMILPSLFLILSIGFLFLYFDNFSERLFLFISFFLFLAGYLSNYFYDSVWLIEYSVIISKAVLNQWEYLIIIIGTGVLIQDSKSR